MKLKAKTGGFVLGKEPSEPNPCPLCGCAMGVLAICPNFEGHRKLNPFDYTDQQLKYSKEKLLKELREEVGGMKIDKVKAMQVLLGENRDYGTAFGKGYNQAKQDVIKLLEKYETNL
jgi:hypothetical protein